MAVGTETVFVETIFSWSVSTLLRYSSVFTPLSLGSVKWAMSSVRLFMLMLRKEAAIKDQSNMIWTNTPSCDLENTCWLRKIIKYHFLKRNSFTKLKKLFLKTFYSPDQRYQEQYRWWWWWWWCWCKCWWWWDLQTTNRNLCLWVLPPIISEPECA